MTYTPREKHRYSPEVHVAGMCVDNRADRRGDEAPDAEAWGTFGKPKEIANLYA